MVTALHEKFFKFDVGRPGNESQHAGRRKGRWLGADCAFLQRESANMRIAVAFLAA
jgi:hypothetical protein